MARSGPGSTYSQAVADEICGRIAEGESLVEICGPKRQRRLPHRQTVYVWLAERADFKRAYLRARDIQADRLFDEIVPIADGRDEGSGEPRDLSRDRFRVDARRFAIARLAPKRYGDRVTASEEAEPVEEMSTAERAARIVAILEAVRRRNEGEG